MIQALLRCDTFKYCLLYLNICFLKIYAYIFNQFTIKCINNFTYETYLRLKDRPLCMCEISFVGRILSFWLSKIDETTIN